MKITTLSLFILVFLVACNKPAIQTNMQFELNQNWKLTRVSSNETYPAKVPGCVHTDLLENKVIEDPYYRTNEKKLQWIDKEDWQYASEFTIDKQVVDHEFNEMVFNGLDTYADVYLNDSLVLKADNMFREWKIECKGLLKEGTNTLRVYLHSPIKTGLKKLESNGYALPASNDQSENGELGDKRVSIFSRKAPYHYGWDWGPRFVTSGIWRPVVLKAWSNAKINHVQIVQDKLDEKEATITHNLSVTSSKPQELTIIVKNGDEVLFKEKKKLEEGDNLLSCNYQIKNPKLWWTNGLGEQNLYTIHTSVIIGDNPIESNETVIGLRTLKLVQQDDESGQSFHFELNGVPVFMKGANHIPNDLFIPRISDEVYEWEIKTAVESNMNMLRVWGGGIYENDIFYELCNKYGILVWQDFMFACSMYPGNEVFIESVRQEAIDNVIRLRNHPSVALWCGNNEIDVAWSEYSKGGWGWKEQYTPEQRKEIWQNYEKVFHEVLPQVCEKHDPSRSYWPSSPMAGPKEHSNYSSTKGDMHYWGVWHGKEPFSQFLKVRARFMSEYGFQSFPDLYTVQKYALPEDYNIESEVMAAHQRSGIGNLRIKEYLEMYYKKPKNFESFLYVGQVLQAEGIKMAIEAHRRDMPYNMGTLYWQMNDCWPVASWSGMDYFGRWKALQYFVKKAFKPVLVSPLLDAEKVDVYIVSDNLKNQTAKLKLELMDFNGKILLEEIQDIEISANTSKIYDTRPLKELLAVAKAKNSLLASSVLVNDEVISSNILYLSDIKNLDLPKPKFEYTVSQSGEVSEITISADKLAKNIYLTMEGDEGFFSDNYFDLLPNKPVKVKFTNKTKGFETENKLKIVSLIDSY
jgi:beta-mannosidase